MKIERHLFAGFRFLLVALVVAVFACPGATPADRSPVAEFPAFIPFPVSTEGVAVDKFGNVYVSVRDGNRGKIWKFTPPGEQSVFADIGVAMAAGLAVDAEGDVYIAMAVGVDRGVYRINRHGHLVRLPGTEQIVFANALAFDHRGNLYVTESYSMDSPPAYGPGGIWRIPQRGEAELWLRDDLLTGIGAVLGYPVGANGIAFYHGDLYVVNTDKGNVVRIPVKPDGSPGLPDVWAVLQEVPGSPMAGSPFPVLGDGLALDVHGNIYVAVVSRSAIVRINADDKSQETIAALFTGTPLDTPASLAFGTGKGGRKSLFVANLGWLATINPGPSWPGPGLVKIEAGVPGLPLP